MAGILTGLGKALWGNENEFKADAYKDDPNAFQYGGAGGIADADVAEFKRLGTDAQRRQGEAVNYGQANQDRAMSLDARSGLSRMAGAMEARAMGQGPSIAQMQADRQMRQAQAAQASQMSSARGAAGLAMAQQNAANAMANAQADISGQAQVNAAQERLAAEQAAAGAFQQMRGGDIASQAQSAQQAQYQAQLNAQQRQQNDAYQMGMMQNAMNVRNAQLTASQNRENLRSNNYNNAQSINSGVAAQNAGFDQQNAHAATGIVTGAIKGIGSVLGLEKGGPAMSGTPYIVGEKGPELIVPRDAGYVIPAPQTKKIMTRVAGGAVLAAKFAPQLANSIGATGGTAPVANASAAGNMTSPLEAGKGAAQAIGAGPGGPGGASLRKPDYNAILDEMASGSKAAAQSPVMYQAPSVSTISLVPIAMREGGGPVQGAEPDYLPLYNPPGKQLMQTADGHAYLADEPSSAPMRQGAGLAAMQSQTASPTLIRKPLAPQKSPSEARKMTPDELQRAAQKMMDEMRTAHLASMARGPAVNPRAK
jgi:hypothetical protein